MTNAEFTPLFDRLWTAFGWSAPEREKAERAALYFRVLGDLPAASLSHAVDRALASEDKFPKPAVLRRLGDGHLAAMRGAMTPATQRMVDAAENPKCPWCGLVGPWENVLTHDDGSPKYYPADHPDFPGEAMVRVTMTHYCERASTAPVAIY